MGQNIFYEEFLRRAVDETDLTVHLTNIASKQHSQGDVNYLLAALSIIPEVGNCFEGARNIANMAKNDQIQAEKKAINNIILNTLSAIKPEQFESWGQCQQYAEVFNLIESADLLEGEERSRFVRNKEMMQEQWKSHAIKVEQAQLNHLGDEMKAGRVQMQLFQSELRGEHSEYLEGQKQCQNELQTVHGKVDVVNTYAVKLMDDLRKMGIHVDTKLEKIIHGNKQIASQVNIVVNHVQKMEQQQCDRQKQALRQANFNGVSQACGFVAQLGDVVDCKPLAQVGFVGQQAVVVAKTIDSMKSLSGIALLGPYATIGMVALRMFSLFGKKNQTSMLEIILNEIRSLRYELSEVHRDLKVRIEGLHQHIDRVADRITYHLDHVYCVLTMPVMQQLGEIGSSLDSVIKLVDNHFHYTNLKTLRKSFSYADRLLRGAVPIDQDIKQQVIKHLVATHQFVSTDSFSRMITGQYVLSGVNLSALQQCQILDSSNSKIDYLAAQLLYQKPNLKGDYRLPHTQVWLRSVAAYLMLRVVNGVHFSGVYDAGNKELKTLFNQAKNACKGINLLQEDKDLMRAYEQEYKICYDEINHVVAQTVDDCVGAFSKDNLGLSLFGSFSGELNTIFKNQTRLPLSHESVEYIHVQGRDMGKRKGRHRNVDSQLSVDLLVDHQLKENKLILFPPEVLFALNKGWLNVSMHMHQSMSNGGEQKWQSEGGKYGLEINIHFKARCYTISEATPGKGKWPSCKHNHDRGSENAHRENIPNLTKVCAMQIQRLVSDVRAELSQSISTSTILMCKTVRSNLQSADGPLYRLLAKHRYLARTLELMGFSKSECDFVSQFLPDVGGSLRDFCDVGPSTHIDQLQEAPEVRLPCWLDVVMLFETLKDSQCAKIASDQGGFHSSVAGQLQLGLTWLTRFEQAMSAYKQHDNKFPLAELVRDVTEQTRPMMLESISVSEFQQWLAHNPATASTSLVK